MKTLLVDDHVLILAGLQNFLTANGIEVAGTARNGTEALIQYAILKPDLVLMDLQMAGLDGIETTRILKKDYPEAKIVMLTAIEDEEKLFAALQAGAEGYLLKDMEPESFLRQLAVAAAGEMPIAPNLAQRLLRTFSGGWQTSKEVGGETARELTERQTDLLQMLVEGMTYKEIAARLNLKESTVKYHVKEILAKLQLGNRTQLITHALRQGLVKNGPAAK
ncbi:MAG TPA: response regulator transcription factor [Patescibacteria group bacterium]|nr:response regulator transcription factor [Patescibacteria group bacterium]